MNKDIVIASVVCFVLNILILIFGVIISGLPSFLMGAVSAMLIIATSLYQSKKKYDQDGDASILGFIGLNLSLMMLGSGLVLGGIFLLAV
ncbi:hypothetical protein A3K29_04665 [Candidatus Collierbacteria bacterium RIFOXYB2_FULL_46_14]|uniref:Uncharacterized protein n=1 Tax=Candidatus Collierbacteria bacterium GW2011_GWA2_46_26 TaxID=1618381 RepID=A0A0G1SIJ9_9BACT|nr:MAG: hypothetical protein UW29_C0005G0036 [Candidatus Collierbacteria bacterium GW2011_GWC2_44_13]KKU33130.1 MAG: hypothetical protein UX47_C0006G0101 [Candidatus Collierbacteria bacterium GW2011_GWA2_46_26]OGD73391.1 MAG: hypothetical protein A3K29_04665 [Candidatus Collierbacteria bacterium RIFOXYB2_FULL_46_14]OGD76433.1 MAG: hypothetical protein A3K43_04665 [Candidatus Collierbacteria bacterium RIFOXYA2_FULL_46_20]OGD77769.1 MAG: hypothetical protein A3K39_04665 [Candidatus Collierbacteri